MNSKLKKVNQYSWALVGYTFFVILWGAFVKISHSGDGCGKSWPLCQDNWIPTENSTPMWIEFTHRITSGVFGVFVFILVFYIFKNFKGNKYLKTLAATVGFFTITEALLGAALVLGGLVGKNDTVIRAIVMIFHLVNSLLLIGSITILADSSRHFLNSTVMNPFKSISRLTKFMIFLFLVMACTGAVASLSTTLFPSESLLSGLIDDFSKESHFLIRLRIYHPLLATVIGVLLTFLTYQLSNQSQNTALQKRLQILSYLFFSGIFIGFITLFLLSPVVLKLLHLSWAYLIWIYLVLSINAQVNIQK
jgi:cytochrome c oxidase assembly protein subunit 15